MPDTFLVVSKQETLGGALEWFKNLIGIPWRVAFALQNDGWNLRSDIIWHKPNPTPESVQDRPTRSHEYIFLMSKSRNYYYDINAIKEKAIWAEDPDNLREHKEDRPMFQGKYKDNKYGGGGTSFQGHSGNYKANGELINPDGMKNKRDVWTVQVRSYKEAHFATYPKELIEPCIKAGCPKGGIVLDPFMGSGTTALVSMENDRKYCGIELNGKYIEIAKKKAKRCLRTNKLFSNIGENYARR